MKYFTSIYDFYLMCFFLSLAIKIKPYIKQLKQKICTHPLQLCLNLIVEFLLWYHLLSSSCMGHVYTTTFLVLLCCWQWAFPVCPCSSLTHPTVLCSAGCAFHFNSYPVHNSSRFCRFPLLSVSLDVPLVTKKKLYLKSKICPALLSDSMKLSAYW